ncbi:MAG: GNAT family N-acetyltransferase [Candidatus Heimdallarchaeota archaeon]|nr:GNAT family N-acetyltransferase [Candidatus Heimdallarchaeota archaeon]
MRKNNEINLKDLNFRQIKERERMTFYEYAFESTKDRASSMGISFDFLKKFCKINRILLGLPGKILMKDIKDIVTEIDGEIAAGFTIMYDKKKDKYGLGNVFTRPKFQRRGLGNAVMKHIIQSYGDKKMDLGVDKTNSVAIHLYEKYDFIEESIEDQFLGDLPFPSITPPEGYTVRLATKTDLRKLDRIKTEIPNMNDIEKSYRKAFNKTEKKKLRISNQLPGVLLKEDQIVGIGRARWSKGLPDTAQVIAIAVLPEAVDAYPSFISFLANSTEKYGLKKYIWDLTKTTELFSEVMRSVLGEPFRSGVTMVREIS